MEVAPPESRLHVEAQLRAGWTDEPTQEASGSMLPSGSYLEGVQCPRVTRGLFLTADRSGKEAE